MLEKVVHPWPVRIVNRAERFLRATGIEIKRFEPERFKSEAMRKTGLRDFGEDDFEAGLAALCRSAQVDGPFNAMGKLILGRAISGALIQRLRRIEFHRRSPTTFAKSLRPPLIVTGLPRSGTTFLHRLLSTDPEARSLRTWEVRQPIAGPCVDRRRDETARELARLKRAAPALDSKHHFHPDEPEECVMLLNDAFYSRAIWSFCPVFSYLNWMMANDARGAYRAHREYLQIFQESSPDRRLTLKAPAHMPHIGSILEEIPNAMIVQLHREPIEAMTSVASLHYTLHSVVSEEVDPKRIGAADVELHVWAAKQNMAQRAEITSERIVDVRYSDLIADPVACAASIYERFDLPFTETFRTKLMERVANRPKHKFGKHVYKPADFGIDKQTIARRFADYRARFLE